MSAASVEAGKAHVRVSLKNEIDAGVRQIQAKMRSLSGSFRTVGAAAVGAGTAIVAGFGAKLAVNLFSKPIQAAGNFAEVVSKFETVFGKQEKAVKKWATTYGQQVGRSQTQLLTFLGTAQDTFVPLGFNPQEAEGFSKQITQLAVDLASFNNQSDDEAFNRLISAMVGNTENLRAFGVVAQDAQIRAKALSLGFDPKNLTAYQKAITIFQLTLEGTKAAQGDATRTAGSYANQVKALQSSFTDLLVTLGNEFLPLATSVVKTLRSGAQSLAEFAAANGGVVRAGVASIAAIAGLGTAVTTLGFGLLGVNAIFSTIKGGVSLLGTVLKSAGKSVFGLGATTAASTANQALATATTQQYATSVAKAGVSAAASSRGVSVFRGEIGKLALALTAANAEMLLFIGNTGTVGLLSGGIGATDLVPDRKTRVSTKPAGLLGGPALDIADDVIDVASFSVAAGKADDVAAGAAKAAKSTGMLAGLWRLMLAPIGAVTSAVGALASAIGVAPGLVVAAIAAVAVAAGAFFGVVLQRAGVLSAAFNNVKALFGDLTKTFRAAYGGIVNAISAGKIQLAFQIVLASIEVMFWQTVQKVVSFFPTSFQEVAETVGKIFVALGTTIVDVFKLVGNLIVSIFTLNVKGIGLAMEALQGKLSSPDGIISTSLGASQEKLDGLIKQADDAAKSANDKKGKEEAVGGGGRFETPALGGEGPAAASETSPQDILQDRLKSLREETELLKYGAAAAERMKLARQGLTETEINQIQQLEAQKKRLEGSKAAADALKTIGDEIFAMKFGDAAAELKQLAEAGASQTELLAVAAAQRRKVAVEETQKAADAAAEEKKAREEQLKSDGQELTKSTRTPLEKFYAEQKRIAELQATGNIDQETAARAHSQAVKDLRDETGELVANSAALKGSGEADETIKASRERLQGLAADFAGRRQAAAGALNVVNSGAQQPEKSEKDKRLEQLAIEQRDALRVIAANSKATPQQIVSIR